MRHLIEDKPIKIGHIDFLLPIRFRLHFEKESKEEVERRKKIAREKVLQPVSDKELEVDVDDIYPSDKGLGLPRRPSWSYAMMT